MHQTGNTPADARSKVQRAVEEFIERCSLGETLDPEVFAAPWPNPERGKIVTQCRNFLHFDDFVGSDSGKSNARPEADKRRTFGDFLIQEEIGRGGMGVVYLAHQKSLNRRVALKVMASGLTLSKRHVERFRREATAAAQLRHPGIVPVHNFTEVDGTFAFAMDYIAGRNLGEVLDDLRLSNGDSGGAVEGTLGLQIKNGYVAECALLCAQIAGALSAAHAAGITHRDIKPRNIMIDDQRQGRLLDFGLAKSEDQGSISISGEITGTAHYMSPEQTLAKRAGLDHRTDIFSLGVILYELLTLRLPFDGKNLQQIVYQICFQEPRGIHRQNPKVPRDLVTICAKALEKDPQARYQTAQEFEVDLQRFLRWEPIHAKPASFFSRAIKWAHRHRTETVAALLLVVSGLTFATTAWWHIREQRADGERLLALSIERSSAGDFLAAERFATSSLEANPSDETRGKLELIRKDRELAATQQQRMIAESNLATADANLLLARSSSLLAINREQAMRAALDAVDLADSPDARSAVLEALGAGYRTIALGDGTVISVRWSNDGTRIALAHSDGPAAIREAASGKELFRLDESHGPALDIEFHPDGQRFATGERLQDPTQPGCATICNLVDGRELLRLTHIGPVESVQFDSLAGTRLLTVSYGSYEKGPFQARVFDVATGRALGSVTDHARFIVAARISPDGRLIASNGDPGFVRVWDAGNGAELLRLTGGKVREIAFAPGSDLLAMADENRVRLFSLPSGELLGECRHTKEISTVRFDQSGTRLLTASADLTARLWTIDRAMRRVTETQALLGHNKPLSSAAFDFEGQRAITACDDNVVRVFDLAKGEPLHRYEFGQAIDYAEFDPQGRRVLVRSVAGRGSIWDLDGARGTLALRQGSFARAVAFTSNGQQLVTGNDDGHLDVWNTRDGQSLPGMLPKLDSSVRAIDVDPKSSRALVALESGKVAFYNLRDGALISILNDQLQGVHTARFSADGERVLLASDSGIAAVFNARDASRLGQVDLGAPVTSAAISPDGALCATLVKDAICAQLWSLPDGKLVREIGSSAQPWKVVLFLPDGASLLLAGAGDQVQRYSLDNRLLQQFATELHIGHAALDRTGNRLLLCSDDPQTPVAQVFDLSTSKLMVRCTSHHGALLACALSADGAYALTSAKDRTVLVWPTDPVKLALNLRPVDFTPADRRKLSLPPIRSNRPK